MPGKAARQGQPAAGIDSGDETVATALQAAGEGFFQARLGLPHS
jgi:hypothetical protein